MAVGSSETGRTKTTGARRPFPLRVVVVIVVALFIASTALAYEAGTQAGTGPSTTSTVSFLNLSVIMNQTYSAAYGGSGFPQYVINSTSGSGSGTNFTLPEGTVIVTITDHDAVTRYNQCVCNVQGTVGGTETLNGTPISYVSPSNVANTFDVPQLGINVLAPGQSVVSFVLDLHQVGSFRWECLAPCGSGPQGFGFPMFTPGFMEGTMTVT